MNIEKKLRNAKFTVFNITSERKLNGDTIIEVVEIESRVFLKLLFKHSDPRDEKSVRSKALSAYKNHLELIKIQEEANENVVKVGNII